MFKGKSVLTVICRLALLVAVQVVLARFVSVNTMGIRIGFSFIPVMLAAYLFGPIGAGLVSALADLIGSLLFPFGPYHPGFTAMAFLSGVVFGLLLDINGKNDAKYWIRVVLAVVIHCLVTGLLINTLWVSQLYGSKTYAGWMVSRLPEYAVMIPVELIFAPIIKKLSQLIEKKFP